MTIRTEKLDEATLFIDLTPAERGARAKECTKAITELDAFEGAYSEHKKKQIKHIKDQRKRIHDLSIAATTGKEQQIVSCEQLFDIEKRETWYRYKGREYEKREMSDKEIATYINEPMFDDEMPEIPSDEEIEAGLPM